MRKIQVYLAGPLFSQAEWAWNVRLAAALRARYDVTLPQEAAVQMLTGASPFDANQLFQANVVAIDSADVVIAVLDGADPDSGTSWECGYAYKGGRPVIGIRTDLRSGGDDPAAGVNLMLARSCKLPLIVLPPGKREDFNWVVEKVSAAIDEVVKTTGTR